MRLAGVVPPIEAFGEVLPRYIIRIRDGACFVYDAQYGWYFDDKTGKAFDVWDLDQVLHEPDPNPEVRFFKVSPEKVRPNGTPIKPLPLAA